MAWGVFKKIKDGLYKAGKSIKNVAGKVWNTGKNVINKVSGLVPIASTALNSVVPGSGSVLQTSYNAANKFMNSSTGNGISSWLNGS
jgi:hypothetical protein